MADDIHESALRMLSRRALSAREVAERLRRRGFAATAVAAEVRRLEAAGLVDEATLAAALAAGELRRGRGRRAVAAALRRRRLRGEAVRAGEASVTDEEERTSLARALAAAGRRYPGWQRLGDRRQKVVRYLLARGFGSRLVREAVAAARRGGADDAADVEPRAEEDVS